MNDHPKREKNFQDNQQEQAEARATDDGMPVVGPQRKNQHPLSWKAVTRRRYISDARKRLGMGFLLTR
ncbi:hypothetical protein [Burkholderia anthina]|uniref:hypothetical protein n=1 Tax=Burkholderia anthina TaxID=179879 RepID=UPI0037C04FF4